MIERLTSAFAAFRQHNRFVVATVENHASGTVYRMADESVFIVNRFGWITDGFGNVTKHPHVDDVMRAIIAFEGRT